MGLERRRRGCRQALRHGGVQFLKAATDSSSASVESIRRYQRGSFKTSSGLRGISGQSTRCLLIPRG